jgi:hypothetical protein
VTLGLLGLPWADGNGMAGLRPPSSSSTSSPNGRRRQCRDRLQRVHRWTKTFTDPRLCVAIVDRLTFGGNIIETGADSGRLA